MSAKKGRVSYRYSGTSGGTTLASQLLAVAAVCALADSSSFSSFELETFVTTVGSSFGFETIV
jgi:hypothetical protein